MYQRQLMKGGLASAAMTGSAAAGGGKFSREELRQLFNLNEATGSDTRDLMAGHEGLEWIEPGQVGAGLGGGRCNTL